MPITPSTSARWQVSLDTGGTFTDCLAVDPSGQHHAFKVLSSGRLRGHICQILADGSIHIDQLWPFNRDIFNGYQFHLLDERFTTTIRGSQLNENIVRLSDKLPEGLALPAAFEITANEEAPVLAIRLLTGTGLSSRIPACNVRLGTTKGTNALLERKGAKTALIVTKGFGDLLAIGSQQRPDIFSLNIKKPEPLLFKAFEINERIDSAGHVLSSPDSEDIHRIISEIQDEGIESVAICLINSYKNNVHETLIEEALKQAGFPYISVGASLTPAIKLLDRAEAAVVNAYLAPAINTYLKNILSLLPGSRMLVMTSTGGLNHSEHFHPKDSLLSGPAGGVAGAARAGEQSGIGKLLTLDMGGTSTDVARYDGTFDYTYSLRVGDSHLSTSAVNIETVAAGGGSICSYHEHRLMVGPESAGAYPGPACYGAGGPLTMTDVNLLLGRTNPDSFTIPIKAEKANAAFSQIRESMPDRDPQSILKGFLQIANEKMAEAIRQISQRKGFNPADYVLLAFGGAGGQHACQVAELLGISRVLVPAQAGILSAMGIASSYVSRLVQRQILAPLSHCLPDFIENIHEELRVQAFDQLVQEGEDLKTLEVKDCWLYMRLKGQETVIEVPYSPEPLPAFEKEYARLYGHYIEGRGVELESMKLLAASIHDKGQPQEITSADHYYPTPAYSIEGLFADQPTRVFDWPLLVPGCQMKGPCLVVSSTCTSYIEEGWRATVDHTGSLIIHLEETINYSSNSIDLPEVQLSLFTNRFRSIAEEMGAILERTSFSVNVKERLDFSCALLDQNGLLVANAPHIPVHLGSMGMCVRKVISYLPMQPGDVVITNHPGFGGSHLPDITLIKPVYDENHTLLGYVANRAHHAELGGKLPGSMPPDANNLEEEGVVISPLYLFRAGKENWSAIEDCLTKGPYPSRNPQENLADLRGAVASLQHGAELLKRLVQECSQETVHLYMERLREQSAQSLRGAFRTYEGQTFTASEHLDDGHRLQVSLAFTRHHLRIDFSGTSAVHPGNYNATPAIVRSVIMYVLRLLADKPLPLNEGLMDEVEIELPESMLNPAFPAAPSECPAVVGGNTEVSQRLTDTILKALGLAACSQGTMNNLVFGNQKFGYYETIAGGTGAGADFHGADATHQHMTNTKITDPEIMEWRYPVRVEAFSIRKNSGGRGKFTGGNGVERHITFLAPADLTLLAQHRKVAPYGLDHGEQGKVGEQFIIRADGAREAFFTDTHISLSPGDGVIILTPGGGGYGASE